MKRGQLINAGVIIVAVATAGLTWLGNYVLNSPAKEAAANIKTSQSVDILDKKLSTLCNDYGQTVSRMDQNIQNIGKALKVSIVVGKTDNDPCKTN